MLDKLKNFGIVAAIAILFTIFIFAMTNAIYPNPDYSDYCNNRVVKPQQINWNSCTNIPITNCNGNVEYIMDNNTGCPVDYTCDNCDEAYTQANSKHNFVLFLVSAILGLIAILFGIFAIDNPKARKEFWGLTKAGFLLGGLLSLFIGTSIYYQDMGRFLKPIVILIELVIVILVTYKLVKK